MSLMEKFVDAHHSLDPDSFFFEVGQKVRLKVGLSKDGQTPISWEGAIVEVTMAYTAGIRRDHWYRLKDLNTGFIDSFREEEIDARYRKNK